MVDHVGWAESAGAVNWCGHTPRHLRGRHHAAKTTPTLALPTLARIRADAQIGAGETAQGQVPARPPIGVTRVARPGLDVSGDQSQWPPTGRPIGNEHPPGSGVHHNRCEGEPTVSVLLKQVVVAADRIWGSLVRGQQAADVFDARASSATKRLFEFHESLLAAR